MVVDRAGLPLDLAGPLGRLARALPREARGATGIRDPAVAVERHVADSLSGLSVPALRSATTIADVGAGAGFPGLPLAVALPDARVDLIEASARKCTVIERLANRAGIPNARAVRERAEAWAAGEGAGAYDAVVARAVAPLGVLAEYAAPLLATGGALVAWKGARDPAEEETAASAAAELGLGAAEVVPVTPFPAARDRHLHVLVKERPTPNRFPRRPGMAAKRPLG